MRVYFGGLDKSTFSKEKNTWWLACWHSNALFEGVSASNAAAISISSPLLNIMLLIVDSIQTNSLVIGFVSTYINVGTEQTSFHFFWGWKSSASPFCWLLIWVSVGRLSAVRIHNRNNFLPERTWTNQKIRGPKDLKKPKRRCVLREIFGVWGAFHHPNKYSYLYRLQLLHVRKVRYASSVNALSSNIHFYHVQRFFECHVYIFSTFLKFLSIYDIFANSTTIRLTFSFVITSMHLVSYYFHPIISSSSRNSICNCTVPTSIFFFPTSSSFYSCVPYTGS